MYSLSRSAVVAALIAFGAVCAAQGVPKFDDWDGARKAAASSGKPVFMLAYFGASGQTDALALFNGALKAETGIATSAQRFQLACMNLYSREHYPANNGFDPVLEKKFGTPATASVYAPGANRHLWRKHVVPEQVMQNTTLSNDQIKAVFDEATKAWDDFHKTITELEEQAKEDKKLKADPEYQVKLAEAWVKGFAAAPARDAYSEAIKLIRKEDKNDPRVETFTLRIADIEYECEAWAEAAKSYGAFAVKFKDSDKANHARVKALLATAHGGDTAAAQAGLERMQKDKKAADAKDEIEKALEEVKALAAKEGKK